MSKDDLSFEVSRIYRIEGDGRVKAFVDLNVGGQLLLKGLRVVDGPKGLFVSMPQQRGKDKKWYDTIRCLSREAKIEISDCVLSTYQKNN